MIASYFREKRSSFGVIFPRKTKPTQVHAAQKHCLSLLHVQVARGVPCCMPMLHVHAVHICWTSMLRGHAAHSCCMSIQQSQAVCPCYTCVSMLHVHTARSCCLSCSCCMSFKWKRTCKINENRVKTVEAKRKIDSKLKWKGANKFSSFLSHKTEVKRIPLLFRKKDEGKQAHPKWPVWPFSRPFFSDQDGL